MAFCSSAWLLIGILWFFFIYLIQFEVECLRLQYWYQHRSNFFFYTNTRNNKRCQWSWINTNLYCCTKKSFEKIKCLNLMKPHVCSSHIKRYVIGAIQHTHTNRYSGYIFYSLKKKNIFSTYCTYYQHK